MSRCEYEEDKLRAELGEDETDGAYVSFLGAAPLRTRYACSTMLDGTFSVEALEKIIEAMKRVTP